MQTKEKIFILILFICCFFQYAGRAATYYYVGPGTDWNDANNWNLGSVPGSNDDVVLQNTVNLDLSSDVTIKSLSADWTNGQLYISSSSTGASFNVSNNVSFRGSNASLNIDDEVIVNFNKNLSIQQSSIVIQDNVTLNVGDDYTNTQGSFSAGDDLNLYIGKDYSNDQSTFIAETNAAIVIDGKMTSQYGTGSFTLGTGSQLSIDGTLTNTQATFSIDNNSTVNIGSTLKNSGDFLIGDNATINIDTDDNPSTTYSLESNNGSINVGENTNVSISNGMLYSGGLTELRVDAGASFIIGGETNIGSGDHELHVYGAVQTESLTASGGSFDVYVYENASFDVTNDVYFAGVDFKVSNNGDFNVGGDLEFTSDGNNTADIDGSLDVVGELITDMGDPGIVGDGTVTAGGFSGSGLIFGTNASDAYFEDGNTYGQGADGEAEEIDPLPIELASFNAVALSEKVLIQWQTATEENNDFFTIQRSVDGINFDDIAYETGAGNSATAINYEAIDTNPIVGTSYYRLKQTDYNGDNEIFDVVAVTIVMQRQRNSDPIISIDNFNIEIQYSVDLGFVDIELYDVSGRLMTRRAFNSSNGLLLETDHISTGIYIIRMFDNAGFNYSKKIQIN